MFFLKIEFSLEEIGSLLNIFTAIRSKALFEYRVNRLVGDLLFWPNVALLRIPYSNALSVCCRRVGRADQVPLAAAQPRYVPPRRSPALT